VKQSCRTAVIRESLFLSDDEVVNVYQEALDLLSLRKIEWDLFLAKVRDPLRVARLSAIDGARSLLHLAVIDDQRDMVRLLAADPFLVQKRDSFGLCPLDIALLLGRKECALTLGAVPLKRFEYFQGGDIFDNLEYLEQPVFETVSAFETVLTKSAKGKMDGNIHPEKIWMGVYYNHEIQRGYHPPVAIRKVDDDVGYGVFAQERILPCSIVGEYTGVIQERSKKETKGKKYCLRYTVWELGKFIIDAEVKGNFTRFINHCSNPNLGLQSVYWRGIPRMIFIALKEIPKGAQLTFDYGSSYWKEFTQKPKLFVS
jgi:hypothetical protein